MRAEPRQQEIDRIEKDTKRLAKNKNFKDYCTKKELDKCGLDELEAYINKFLY